MVDASDPHPTAHELDGSSSLVDEAAVFASPLPLTGDRKTTTRVELWVRIECGARLGRADQIVVVCVLYRKFWSRTFQFCHFGLAKSLVHGRMGPCLSWTQYGMWIRRYALFDT